MSAAGWDGQPYRLLSVGLKLCNVEFSKIIVISQLLEQTPSGGFTARQENG
jgi:hypothetical protein